jgi:cobalt-zinc-cadmium efflux system outer membrane protein
MKIFMLRIPALLACGLPFLWATAAFSQIDSAKTAQDFYAQLNQLIETARKNNPGLKAAGFKAQASAADARVQKSLDPPQVAVEFYQSPVSSFPNPIKDQQEYDYSIQQMIPFPGKLGSMARAERKRTDMLKADRLTAEQNIVRNVKSLYFELYLKYRQLEINRETKSLVREFVAIARKQYEVGMGKQSDILRAQTELASLANDSIVLIQQRKSMEGMLNALCNRPPNTDIGFIPEIDPVIIDYTLSALLVLAGENRPELKSMQSGTEMQKAESSAAGKEFLPDFMVRGMYKQMVMGPDYWSLMLGATVPIAPWSLGKYSSAVARSDAGAGAAQAEFDNMKNMIASEVNDALLKMESSQERLKLSKETAIPQAQAALQSALVAYNTGKQEFLMLIDIERMLVMAKLDYHMAVMNLLDGQSLLERAVGMNMDDLDKSVNRGDR